MTVSNYNKLVKNASLLGVIYLVFFLCNGIFENGQLTFENISIFSIALVLSYIGIKRLKTEVCASSVFIIVFNFGIMLNCLYFSQFCLIETHLS